MTYETLNSEEDVNVESKAIQQASPAERRRWRRSRKPQYGFGLVEKMFWYYERIKKEVDTVRSEQGYYQSGGKTGGGSSNHAFISDPTATIAMKHYQPVAKVVINAERLDEEVVAQPEKWLIVVEQTFNHFKNEKLISELLKRRFFRNEPMARTCTEIGIGYDKYYRLRDAGISYARECAIQLGLIKVF